MSLLLVSKHVHQAGIGALFECNTFLDRWRWFKGVNPLGELSGGGVGLALLLCVDLPNPGVGATEV